MGCISKAVACNIAEAKAAAEAKAKAEAEAKATSEKAATENAKTSKAAAEKAAADAKVVILSNMRHCVCVYFWFCQPSKPMCMRI